VRKACKRKGFHLRPIERVALFAAIDQGYSNAQLCRLFTLAPGAVTRARRDLRRAHAAEFGVEGYAAELAGGNPADRGLADVILERAGNLVELLASASGEEPAHA
jgi:hypothetical protein